MEIKEYAIGINGTPVDLSKIKPVNGHLPREDYSFIHQNSIVPCHDVFIQYSNEQRENGLLLVRRLEEPSKGILWPIGGRLLRGVPTEESLRDKAKKECGLDLEDITPLGVARVFFNEESLGHEKGYDATSFVYFARGAGNILLNHEHEHPTIITPQQYTSGFRDTIQHLYMRDFMDKAIELVKNP